MNDQTPSVTSQVVPESKRISVLPRHFGRLMLVVETGVFNVMRHLSSAYNGGYWEYYELSNGGFYMAPTGVESFVIDAALGNYYEGTVSSDAAGIIATLYTYSGIIEEYGCDSVVNEYHRLLDFARIHPERDEIFRAID